MENKLTGQQLRIGNLLYFKNTNDICTVELIHKKHFDCRDIDGGFYANGNYEPIPLNEEWLLRFGFEVENFDYKIKISECGVVSMQLIPQDEKCSSFSVCVIQSDEDELDDYVFLSDIKDVHSLQNLYFALTNTELTIK